MTGTTNGQNTSKPRDGLIRLPSSPVTKVSVIRSRGRVVVLRDQAIGKGANTDHRDHAERDHGQQQAWPSLPEQEPHADADCEEGRGGPADKGRTDSECNSQPREVRNHARGRPCDVAHGQQDEDEREVHVPQAGGGGADQATPQLGHRGQDQADRRCDEDARDGVEEQEDQAAGQGREKVLERVVVLWVDHVVTQLTCDPHRGKREHRQTEVVVGPTLAPRPGHGSHDRGRSASAGRLGTR